MMIKKNSLNCKYDDKKNPSFNCKYDSQKTALTIYLTVKKQL